MRQRAKWFVAIISAILVTSLITGCTSSKKDNPPPNEVVKEQPKIVEETTIKIENPNSLITQEGYLNGFPENNLVEFKVIKDNKETLRVFEMGQDIYSYLSKEKQDGKTKFKITYQESKDGITNPIIAKVKMINL